MPPPASHGTRSIDSTEQLEPMLSERRMNAHRARDERPQRALVRYYAAAGAGELAIRVHTTQF